MKYNLIYNLDDAENERSKLLGYPMYEMKCSSCLKFICSAKSMEEVEFNYCPHCGKPLREK